MTTVRLALPAHLRNLAKVTSEVSVEVDAEPTLRTVLDALEGQYPQLRGTMRNQRTGARNSYMRYFACGEDISHDSPDDPLPAAITNGTDVLRIVGAIAGG